MGNFFKLSDFALFEQYANKKQQTDSNGYILLKRVYEKLGEVKDGLKKIGYNVSINRNPFQRAGQGTFKYAPYHWFKVYPKEQKLYEECKDKVFVVVATTKEGLNIHIDSNRSNGWVGNQESDKIQKDTWLNFSPEDSSNFTCDEIVEKVDEYFQKHWIDFNRFAKECGIKLNNMDILMIKTLLLCNYNIILTGAPGTGKTYLAKEIAANLVSNNKSYKDLSDEERGQIGFVQFHPSYDYTDFVEGLRPEKLGSSLGFQRKDGVFKEFCKRALVEVSGSGDTRKPFVFIIDEINRGEISKIFGELFYSIDPGYRGEKGRVDTQYQNLVPDDDLFNDGFYVPDNVFIIGTMNDIDRSVESMDFAMRRRFAWKEVSAASTQPMLDSVDAWGADGKPDQTIVNEIKIRMNNLNACIIDKYGDGVSSSKEKIGLNEAYQIGASYFLKYKKYNDFEKLWDFHLKGLLYEYLRGSSNIEEKIKRLQNAYNDTTAH